jgi:hypothetical protein
MPSTVFACEKQEIHIIYLFFSEKLAQGVHLGADARGRRIKTIPYRNRLRVCVLAQYWI